MSAPAPLVRRAAVEGLGTAALVAVVVGSGIQATELTRDVGVQLLADAMFGEPLVAFSAHERWAGHLWLGEVVATARLVWLVFGLTRAGRAHLAPLLVASYIDAAYWFTSSTSFANPAVTIGRAFTDTFAGISPACVLPFLAAQLLGAAAGLGLVAVCFGRPAAAGQDGSAVPHAGRQPAAPARSTEEGALA
ncbi:antitoxin [Streptomyces sp. NPDC059708]|uniref:antitoxin n=1 Tax=Streptomyces sp. NPDC059708 TaxID=3346916 RepID=UPI00368D24CB